MGLLDPVNGVLSDQSNLYTHTHTLQSTVHTHGMEDVFRVGARVRLSASDLESLVSVPCARACVSFVVYRMLMRRVRSEGDYGSSNITVHPVLPDCRPR